MITKKTTSTIVGKKLLSERISESLRRQKVSLSKIQIESTLQALLEEIKKALVKGEEIRFPSYFSLKTATQAARVAMNLQTKKKMTIPAKQVPKVRFSEELKKEISKAKLSDKKSSKK